MALSDIIAQVVKLEGSTTLDGDAFPVALAGSPLYTGELPVEHAAVGVDLMTVEKWQDIHAIAALRQMGGSAGEGREGGHHIREIDDVVEGLHGHLAWLVDDEGHANASLVELSLAAPETGIAVEERQGRLHGGSIVGGEDDEGVVAQMHAVEGCEQTANGSIHVGDEGGIAFGVEIPRLVIVPHSIVDDIGFVGGIEGEVEEERIALVALDEADGIVGGDVGVMANMPVVGIGADVDKAVVVEPVVGIIIR